MQEKTRIGNVEVLSVLDMYPPPRPTSFFFPDVSEADWAPYKEAQLNKDGEIEFPYCLFALRSQGQTIMLDTGMGAGPHPTRGNRAGRLLEALKKQGIGPEDVDIVAFTHLHADHVGWNITYEGGQARPTFPKARYQVPRLDWEHYTRPEVLAEERNQHVKEHVVPLEALGVMDLVDAGNALTSEVTTIHTPGHTPGSQCFLITSQGQQGIVVGDVFHMSVQVEHPEWCAGVDLDKPTGMRSREGILDRCDREGTMIVAGHFGEDEHFGRIVRLQGKRYWQVV